MAFTDYIYPQNSQAEDLRQQMLMVEQERANQIRLPYLMRSASLSPYAMPSEQAFRGAEVTGMAPSFSAEGKTFFLKPRNQSALIEREKEAARRRGEAFQPIEQSYGYETPSGEKMKGIFMGGPLYMGDGQYLYGTSYDYSPAHGRAGYVERDGRSYKVGQSRGGYSQEYKERQREEQIGNVSARRPSDLSSQEEKNAYEELMRRRSLGSLTGFGGVPVYPFAGQY